MGHLLEIENLKTFFHMHDHVIRAVDGVDLFVDRGETLGVVGESGCGKSVMMLSVMRLIPSPPGRIESGRILLEGEDLAAASVERMHQIRGNRISMIFQEPMTSLNPLFNIGVQISEPLVLHRGMSKAEALAECVRLLELVGIPEPGERVHEYPFQLSGGLRQRVMIAMALACEPFVLIADEPTTALDVTIQAQILRLIRALKEKTNSATVFITHDLAVIASFADRVVVMYAGVAVETAGVRTIFKQPLHPYTRGLLGSVPTLGLHKRSAEGRRNPLTVIHGTLPDPRQFPPGCRFAPRCPRAMDRCSQQEPPYLQVDGNHQVRCYLYGE